jgi:glycosyltransferase involved in cell wall biosynthesis
MDLVADMLLDTMPSVANGHVTATRLQPSMVRRWTRLPLVGHTSRALLADRLAGRFRDYPRWLAARTADYDVFHIVDHSYAHLVKALPPNRAIVTCHDVDAVRAAMPPNQQRFIPTRLLAGRVLEGLGRAAHVACVSHATKAELLTSGAVTPERISVVYEGVHPACIPAPGNGVRHVASSREILHVGSTIPRKRIDILLHVFAGVRRFVPGLRLVRVGGPLNPQQRLLAEELGVLAGIVERPPLNREQLAEAYRGASLLLLPSDREGFGLPLVEAMACGTPVVASAIPALREIGSDAGVYCPPGDIGAWVETVKTMMEEQARGTERWQARRKACIRNAARFSWHTYATEMLKIYSRVSAE